jgi:cysteine desulfurase NifS
MMAGKKKITPAVWQQAVCGICPSGCWVEVLLKNGRLADIRQDSSVTLGMLCRRGQHASEIVYSKTRLKTPLKRVGAKGGYDFEPISWDEAYDIIDTNLKNIKEESGPTAMAIYTGRGAQELSLCDMYQPQDITISSASNILFPFGSPNTMGVGALCYVSLHMIAPHVTMGRMQPNIFADIENAAMVVVWGTNPSTDSPPVDMLRLEAAAKRGAEIVVIDPRRTEAVQRTDALWLPIRPGTDGALALSLIQVLIEDDLYDEDFTENYCLGFEELATYAQHFRPETAAAITGINADTIRKLAHSIANASGCSLLMYTGLEYSNSGCQTTRAVYTLFALANQLDVPGGIGLTMMGSEFPINRSTNLKNPCLEKAIARENYPVYSLYRGESHAIGLVDSVLKGEPYPIRGLIIHGSSMLTSWPQTPLWRQTLNKLDFLVCIDRQMTADAAYADVVLPATTMFENLSYMTYGPVFRIRERVIEPVGEARNDYLIMAGLAQRLGYGHLFPQTEEAMLCQALKGSGYTLEDVRKAGGWVRINTPMIEYKKWQKGHLRPDGKPGFDTPTSKFEIWSTILEDYGYEPLPKYTEPVEGPLANHQLAAKYPLVFNSGARPDTDFRSQHHGIEGLVKDNPEPTVEINEDDARQRGIKNGDLVEVRTLRGSVPFRARVSTNIVKGAVECTFGGGTPIGPKAWQRWNVNELTDLKNLDPISGFPVYKALLCDVVGVAKGTSNEGEDDRKDTCHLELVPVMHREKPARQIYLDNNATTRMANAVRQMMLPYLGKDYGNPSSIYDLGREAGEAIKRARRQVAHLINTRPQRVIFTGGGTEADNLALKGVAFALKDRGKHIITSTIEHPAVLNSCNFLESQGFIITYLGVDGDGLIDPQRLKEALRHDTILVSVIMASNEMGSIQPIEELAAITRQKGIIFHSDAVQAVGKIKVDVEELGVDLLSLSGHKIHGPKGVGALYVRKGITLEPFVHGGKQEAGLRAGTENVAAIAGLGKATELIQYNIEAAEKIRVLRDKLEDGIRKLVPEARLNGHPERRLPNTLNLTLPGLRGESIVIAMNQHGVCISSGSACKSGSPEPTPVLLAMGKTEEEAHCAIRFSLSDETTGQDIDEVIATLAKVLKEKSNIRLMACK